MNNKLKPFMRIVLDMMPDDPQPIECGEQGSFVGYDGMEHLMISWDNGRSLQLIEGVDKYHIIDSTGCDAKDVEEIKKSFVHLCRIQEKLSAGESSRCPRCGKLFDARRGAVSRKIQQVMICDLCGQQEALEDFIINGEDNGAKVEIYVPCQKREIGISAESFDEKKT